MNATTRPVMGKMVKSKNDDLGLLSELLEIKLVTIRSDRILRIDINVSRVREKALKALPRTARRFVGADVANLIRSLT